MKTIKRLRAIDLCCGAGGWACAARGLPIEFVAVADLAADSLDTWRINHAKEHHRCELLQCDLATDSGIETVLKSLGGKKVDIVLGGLPCEQVSTNRQNKPASDEELATWRGLVDRVLSVVGLLQPRWWAIEDVIQIDRHLPTALELGWDIPIHRIDSSRFGPQKRIRTFLGRFPVPQAEPGPRTLGEVLRPGPHRTLVGHEGFERHHCRYYGANQVRIWLKERAGFVVTDMRNNRSALIEEADGRIRFLSWEEAARVQGFPDDYLFAASFSRGWKMVGQAIPIYVGRAILKAVCAEAAVLRQTTEARG